MPVIDLDRLGKLCARFGSPNDHERATAALKADELVRASGLTWDNVTTLIIEGARKIKADQEKKDAVSGRDWAMILGAISVICFALIGLVEVVGDVTGHYPYADVGVATLLAVCWMLWRRAT